MGLLPLRRVFVGGGRVRGRGGEPGGAAAAGRVRAAAGADDAEMTPTSARCVMGFWWRGASPPAAEKAAGGGS